MGILAKDTAAGPFAEEWKKAYGDMAKDFEEVDITPALSIAALAVKDETELVGQKLHGSEYNAANGIQHSATCVTLHGQALGL